MNVRSVRNMMIRSVYISVMLIAGLFLTGCAVTSSSLTPEIQHVLAPTGTLRVALYTGTPTSLVSAADPRGVGHDLGTELARRLGVPVDIMVFPKNDDVLEAIKTGRADVAFTNASAERATGMDFTQPYLLIEMGFLAANDAGIAVLADVDKPGIRVGATANSTSAIVLLRDLKNAKLVTAQSVGAGIEMLAKGQAEVYATNKATLYKMSEKLPGSHVLDGNWGFEHHALAIPKGRDLGLPFARQFISDVITEGFVKNAIERAGLRGGIVAPPQ